MRIFEWAIEDIITAYPSLCMDDFAAVATLLMRQTRPPCDFLVRVEGFEIPDLEGDQEFVLSVTWNAATESRAERAEHTRQRKPIVEEAAIALAVLLVAHLLPDSDLRVTDHGSRADFLLPKMHRVLEISGTERARDVRRRARQKRRQVLENPLGWDGYVVICCFEAGHRLIQWTCHSQPE
jgi:hypothetical protein